MTPIVLTPRTAAVEGYMKCRLALVEKINRVPDTYNGYAAIKKRIDEELACIDKFVFQLAERKDSP